MNQPWTLCQVGRQVSRVEGRRTSQVEKMREVAQVVRLRWV